MAADRSYLRERRSARRWRAITGVVAAGALAAAAVWTLGRPGSTYDGASLRASAHPLPGLARPAAGTALR
jgi:hypothetical protein